MRSYSSVSCKIRAGLTSTGICSTASANLAMNVCCNFVDVHYVRESSRFFDTATSDRFFMHLNFVFGAKLFTL